MLGGDFPSRQNRDIWYASHRVPVHLETQEPKRALAAPCSLDAEDLAKKRNMVTSWASSRRDLAPFLRGSQLFSRLGWPIRGVLWEAKR